MARCFVSLAALCTLSILVGCAEDGTGAGVTGSSARFTVVGRPVMEYRFADVPFKPYVKELYSPAGVNVLRDSPVDHKHHHALMFAIAVDGVNFWEEATPAAGKEIHVSQGLVTSSKRDQTKISLAEKLEWVKPVAAASAAAGNEKLLLEDRTIQYDAAPGIDATLLTWRSVLSLPPGKPSAQLTGSHYFGLGARFLESMDKTGQFIFPAGVAPGTVVRGDERVTRANWCAYAAKADGKDVTIAIFDDPNNPRHPATFFTMGKPFSYISATLNLWKEPMNLAAGQKLDLRYGVAVWDGTPTAEQIERLYRKWAGMAAATE